MDKVNFSPQSPERRFDDPTIRRGGTRRKLTREIEDENGQKSDVYTRNDEIDQVEQRFASDEQGECHIEIRIILATIVEKDVSHSRLKSMRQIPSTFDDQSNAAERNELHLI